MCGKASLVLDMHAVSFRPCLYLCLYLLSREGHHFQLAALIVTLDSLVRFGTIRPGDLVHKVWHFQRSVVVVVVVVPSTRATATWLFAVPRYD